MVASFISCDTKTIEVQKSGGVWHMGGDDQFQEGTSPKAVIGSESDLEIAMAFYSAYGDMELDKMVELSEDVVKFHPGDLAGVVDVDTSNTDFVVERQSTFESIKRTLHNVTPISTVGSENYTIVSINFTEEITKILPAKVPKFDNIEIIIPPSSKTIIISIKNTLLKT